MLFLTAAGIKVVLSNAGKVTTDKHLMGEGNRRSLGSKKLVDHSFRTASEPEL